MNTENDDDIFNGPVSPQMRACALELMAVCRKHGMQLCVSDYDELQLWRAHPGDSPIYSAGLSDKTQFP